MKISEFINFVIDLMNEEYSEFFINTNAKDFFLRVGCYDLVKIVKHYYPNSKIMIHINNENCAIEYKGEVYNASGIVNKDNYKKASSDDISYLETYFNPDIEVYNQKSIPENLIYEIDKCNILKKT